jgi:hypothetical protein
MMCRRRQVAFINDVIITNAFSISRVMSEDSILLDIKKREIGLITVFITSSLIVIICAHEELIRPNEAALLLNNLIVVVWRIHLL